MVSSFEIQRHVELFGITELQAYRNIRAMRQIRENAARNRRAAIYGRG